MAVSCLIVDDNHEFLRAARDLLEREGIIDIDLGEENGFDIARQLAGGEGAAQARVILISTYAEDDFADMIADSPALSFLSKSGLSGAAIRGILRRAGGEPV